jgi:hypothetical protein
MPVLIMVMLVIGMVMPVIVMPVSDAPDAVGAVRSIKVRC